MVLLIIGEAVPLNCGDDGVWVPEESGRYFTYAWVIIYSVYRMNSIVFLSASNYQRALLAGDIRGYELATGLFTQAPVVQKEAGVYIESFRRGNYMIPCEKGGARSIACNLTLGNNGHRVYRVSALLYRMNYEVYLDHTRTIE